MEETMGINITTDIKIDIYVQSGVTNEIWEQVEYACVKAGNNQTDIQQINDWVLHVWFEDEYHMENAKAAMEEIKGVL